MEFSSGRLRRGVSMLVSGSEDLASLEPLFAAPAHVSALENGDGCAQQPRGPSFKAKRGSAGGVPADLDRHDAAANRVARMHHHRGSHGGPSRSGRIAARTWAR